MYVTPGSITPDRLWCVGVVKSSLTHINFISSKFGILQLLRPQQLSLVKLLGSSSGRDVDKQRECGKLGFEWQPLEDEIGADGDLPLTLPGCAHYLLLRCIEVVDGGSHGVFICKPSMERQDKMTMRIRTCQLGSCDNWESLQTKDVSQKLKVDQVTLGL